MPVSTSKAPVFVNTPSLFLASCSAISSVHQSEWRGTTISHISVHLADVQSQLVETQGRSGRFNVAGDTTSESQSSTE